MILGACEYILGDGWLWVIVTIFLVIGGGWDLLGVITQFSTLQNYLKSKK